MRLKLFVNTEVENLKAILLTSNATNEQQSNNNQITNNQQQRKNNKKEKKEKKYNTLVPSQLPEGIATVEEYIERIAQLKGIDVDAVRI